MFKLSMVAGGLVSSQGGRGRDGEGCDDGSSDGGGAGREGRLIERVDEDVDRVKIELELLLPSMKPSSSLKRRPPTPKMLLLLSPKPPPRPAVCYSSSFLRLR